jgi:hypothetical protein
MLPTIEFAIAQGDIFTFDTDVVALKYARAFYGADERVAAALTRVGISPFDMQPDVGTYSYVETLGQLNAKHALFVGVQDLFQFGYPEIRHFAAQVLEGINRYAPSAEHVGMTIHGVGYGLDEAEACRAQLEGCLDAIQTAQNKPFLPHLRTITIVERDAARVDRLRDAIDQYVSSGTGPAKASKSVHAGTYLLDTHTEIQRLPVARGGAGSRTEPHVFVAMPFDNSLDVHFHYGIKAPVNASGYLCERMDHISFTGDIMSQLKRKIETATLVIAEMSGANPNVYLEVGYAWGKDRPTLLLAKNSEELEFDVKGHRCIVYRDTMDLEEKLRKDLAELKRQKRI